MPCGDDLRAALGGIGLALDDQGTVDIHSGVNEIVLRPGICLSGGIQDRIHTHLTAVTALALQIAEIIRHPFISIVYVNLVPALYLYVRVFGDVDTGAGEECNILPQGDFAAFHVDADVVGNGQNKIRGVYSCETRNIDDKAVDGANAVHVQRKSVRAAVIRLDKATAAHPEHTLGGMDKRNGCSHGSSLARHQTSHGVFFRTGLHGHCGFNVLDVVLRQGENALGITGHCQGHRTAAETGNLHQLIDLRAAVHRNGAGSVDVAERVKTAVHHDLTSAVQVDIAAGTCGAEVRPAAVGGIILRADRELAVYGQLGPVRKRQRLIGSRREISAVVYAGVRGGLNVIRKAGVVIVIGNQKRIALRNRNIIRQRIVLYQDDRSGADAGSIGLRVVKAVKITVVDAEWRIRAGNLRKQRRNGHVLQEAERSRRLSRKGDLVRFVIPADELVSLIRHSGEIVGFQSGLLDRSRFRDRRPIHGIGTVFRGFKGHAHICFIRIEANIGNRDSAASGLPEVNNCIIRYSCAP